MDAIRGTGWELAVIASHADCLQVFFVLLPASISNAAT
jgi:hypothetical protein